ncbi:Dihydrolipoyl dehydrogenase [uncultured delta proteobacterium]|uniref:Dihydrolipoyl dehydrogenase n=1 Tax=uncultured delta proteobacterium TaxID=34034 RepID=A0A212J955_9DELT|nr:Dihydrolipoyl dehydrogenase [uncultured delta proteobacterium]
MAAYEFDILVIGGGPGGYVAAIKAAKEGKKVCIAERANFGGVCLNEGCIPTKTLIKTANALHEIKEAAAFGIEGVNPAAVSVSMEKLQKRKKGVVQTLVGGVKGLLRGNKVTAMEGSAAFVDAHTVDIAGKKVTFDSCIIATGSNVLMPSFIKQEGKNRILTSREALDIDTVPASVAIIGGGVIGVEFAYLFNRLGSKVTVIELMENILPMVDEEVSGMAKKRLEKDGVAFHMGAKVHTVKDNAVLFEKGGKQESVKADYVLMAVGRVANTDGLKAKEIGIEFEKAAIKTDATLRTNIPNIYAIGDVNGKVMLAHTASHEGIVAVDAICGKHARMDYSQIPSCIYLDPEIACIGLTEKQAKEQGKQVKIGKFPMAANGKSLVEGDTDGLAKVIVDAELGEILGVHLYGKHTTDMIAELAVAMTLEATAEEIIHSIHPHPTVSEALPEAFMAAYGKAVHCM